MATTWQLTVDCADTDRLVQFWCAALGYEPEPPPQGWATWWDYWRAAGLPEEELEGAEQGSGAIVDPAGVGPRIWFQEVPEAKVAKNRLHLDLRHTPGRESMAYAERRSSVDAEVARLTALGASVAYTNAPEGADYYAVTMRDPEGNEFCVV
jgi:catechol 2,3-dioxygenase-like lactoylglutathione lyase family enzyme